jgi:TPR repeat protein
MKHILLFLSSFIIAVGAAVTLWLCLAASPFQREFLRAWFNNPKAQFHIGTNFQNGVDTKKDLTKARYWYSEAAMRGSETAAFNLGLMTLKGEGGAQDEKAAVTLFKMAAAKGHVKAEMNLARCAFLGLGTPQSEAEAADWVKKAADAGAPEAAALMGMLSLGGIGVPQDHDVAIKWLKKSKEPEAKELADRLDAQNTILDALPAETRAAQWKMFYAQMESSVRNALARALEKQMTPEGMQ